MFRNTQNELEVNGKSLDIKEPRLDREFGIDPNESTSASMATRGSGFMPNMRIEAGQAAYNGKRSMGVVENAKQQIQVMLSTLNVMGGETKLPVIGPDNKNLGTLRIKLRKFNKVTGEVDEVIGDTFRYYGYNASNRATDASNYPKMKNGSEMRDILTEKAFDLEFTDVNGRKRTGTWWDLVKTDFGIISDVNQKMYGKFINDLQVGKVNPETGARERNWYDIYRYKDMAEWSTMQPAAKEYVKEHIKKFSGNYIWVQNQHLL